MKRLLLWFLLLFVACLSSATAATPDGKFTYAFTNTPLWDVSGGYQNTAVAHTVQVSVLQQAADGLITGTQVEEYYLSTEDHYEARGPIVGRISVRGGAVRATLQERGTVTDVSNGDNKTGTYTGKASLTIEAPSLTLTDTGAVQICVTGLACDTTATAHVYPLPAGMTGDWTLETDITATGDKLTGIGTVTLSNGRALRYQITGDYSRGNQVAELTLRGTGTALGTSLFVITYGPAMELLSLTGKVLGQKPIWP